MSTIYRLQFLLIAAAAILAAAFPANAQTTLEAVKQKGVLVAGSSAEYPPFEYVADGKLVGYDVDMAEEITRRMGVKVAWEKIDFKGIVAALTAKRVDVLITALTWTPERAERIAFSDPYFDAGIGAITPRSSTIEKAEDLTGRKVGVQLGSSGERYVRETIGSKVGQLLTYDSITLAINDLKNGRVEAVVNPLPVLSQRLRIPLYRRLGYSRGRHQRAARGQGPAGRDQPTSRRPQARRLSRQAGDEVVRPQPMM
jgi:ABC-type amino acid transport substrate-binding protein